MNQPIPTRRRLTVGTAVASPVGQAVSVIWGKRFMPSRPISFVIEQ